MTLHFDVTSLPQEPGGWSERHFYSILLYYIVFHLISSYLIKFSLIFFNFRGWSVGERYFILSCFYFILFYFILSFFIFFYLILFNFILSDFILSYLILSNFILFYLILCHFILCHFILFYFIFITHSEYGLGMGQEWVGIRFFLKLEMRSEFTRIRSDSYGFLPFHSEWLISAWNVWGRVKYCLQLKHPCCCQCWGTLVWFGFSHIGNQTISFLIEFLKPKPKLLQTIYSHMTSICY